MSAVVSQSWAEANQRHLRAALAAVRHALARHAGDPTEPDPPPLFPTDTDEPPALDAVTAAFDLSAFERDVLLLCAGVELDGTFAAACADAHGDPAKPYPTFGLALATLSEPHWSAITPESPLRRSLLIEVAGGHPLTAAPLRIAEPVLHFLAGISQPDPRVAAVGEEVPPPDWLPASHAAAAAATAAAWVRSSRPLVRVTGPDPGDRRAVAAAAAARCGWRLIAVPAALLPTTAADGEEFARLWEREAALRRAALLVEYDDADPARATLVARLAARLSTPVAVAGREPLPVTGRPVCPVEVPMPAGPERRAVWRAELGDEVESDESVAAVAAQFALPVSAVRSIAAVVGAGDLVPPPADRLWAACREWSRPRVEGLANRVEPATRWDDLVLPADATAALRQIADQVRLRAVVTDDWGFAAAGGRGLGVSALFTGASGTGKTTAAEVIARELRLDLYVVDLSAVVSKYIGETEKNLARVFDAAEQGGAVLQFDEADALFGRRSEVKDSHDRYANIEVSYLLQRMESYRGLAVLTTNLKSALDPSFLRRLGFVVPFPFPDAAARERIWRQSFPPAAPADGLDFTALASVPLAGGNIRAVSLRAAYLAAAAGRPIGMPEVGAALRAEYVKLDRPVSELEGLPCE